jgi:hypothetical protein
MLSPRRSVNPRRRLQGLLALGTAAATACVLALGACIVEPPPDLPPPPVHRPTILHDAVFPDPAQILNALPPGGFRVPIVLEDQNESYCYAVLIDFDQYNNNTNAAVQDCTTATPASADGGVDTVFFSINTLDPAFCHTIEFIVAAAFNKESPYTPTSLGGDLVTWLYNPSGGESCPLYDAGGLGEGGFVLDAAMDGLPLVPESGGGAESGAGAESGGGDP